MDEKVVQSSIFHADSVEVTIGSTTIVYIRTENDMTSCTAVIGHEQAREMAQWILDALRGPKSV